MWICLVLFHRLALASVPERFVEHEIHGHRWMTVQLVGEGTRRGDFQKRLAQYPTIGIRVHLVTEEDLKRIYGRPTPQISSRWQSFYSEAIPALVDI